MAIELKDSGTGNRVELHPWFEKYGLIRIQFNGDNSVVRILSKPRDCRGMQVQLGSDSTLTVGDTCGLSNTFIYGKDNCHVAIGDFTTFTARCRFVMHETGTISLGRDCMIASDVQFMNSDVHTIYDLATRRRINWPNDITVGEHVWISLQTYVLKGSRIGSGSVVGLRSVVSGEIPTNCVAVGSPARVVRKGASWDRHLWGQAEGLGQLGTAPLPSGSQGYDS